MKQIPNEARNKNVTGHHFCSWCADTGYVVANLRAVKQSAWARQRELQPNGWYEEVAPCPYCEAGYREEFPEPSHKHPTKVPWGVDGYWADVDGVELEPLYAPNSQPLGREENGRRMAELMASVKALPVLSRWI